RALDADLIGLECVDRLIRQPGAELIERLLARQHLLPDDAAPSAVCLFHRGVEHPLRRTPDVWSGTVSFDERNYRGVGHLQLAIRHADGLTRRTLRCACHND